MRQRLEIPADGLVDLLDQGRCLLCGRVVIVDAHTHWLLLTREEDAVTYVAIDHPHEATRQEIAGFGLWPKPISRCCLKERPDLFNLVLRPEPLASHESGRGMLGVGVDDARQVVVNLDRDRTGHIVFSQQEAREFGALLIRKAEEASNHNDTKDTKA
jgi:hypothetical protein